MPYERTDEVVTTDVLRGLTCILPDYKLAVGTDYGTWMRQGTTDLWRFFRYRSVCTVCGQKV